MRRVALVTCARLPALSHDDQRLLAPLAARRIHAAAAAWDDPSVTWDAYDALVIRSTWNYHTSFDAFQSWIDGVEALGVPTWNPPAILRWNASKSYLRELAAAGVHVVPTRWVERGSDATLGEALAAARWTDVVVKPAISASAYETWRIAAGRATDEDDRRFRRLTASGEVMVQPFLPELAREGEWSLMFIAGEYSHAVLKRPSAGDFRVQHEHGGTAEPRPPPRHVLRAAHEITKRVPRPWLYARVDGVEIDQRFVLVELELLEPSLFLQTDANAADRFAEAIRRALSGDSSI